MHFNIILFIQNPLIKNNFITENIALKKPASQSSTAITGFSANALNAVDGNTNQDIYNGSCAHTDYDERQKQTEAWWQVNLTMLSEIVQVNIYYRDDKEGTCNVNQCQNHKLKNKVKTLKRKISVKQVSFH